MDIYKDSFYLGKISGLRYRAAYRPKINLLGKIIKNKKKYSKEFLEKILDKDFINEYTKIKIDKESCVNSSDKVEIFKTIDMGLGIRAKKDLLGREEIGCYYGELKRKGDSVGWKYDFGYALKDYYIDGEMGGYMSYLNHSDNPNVDVIWKMHDIGTNNELHLVFRLNKNVKKGEELFIDYGEEYWEYARKIGIIKTTKQKLITEFFTRI